MQGTLIADVIPGMALVGLGIGISCSPMLTAAMHDVSPTDTGLASGVFSSCSMMGCAIGAAIFAAISSSVSDWRRAAGVSQIAALNEGYHVIFLVAAAVNASAVLFVLKLRISCKSERGNALVRL
jgi:MFS family permease